MDYSLTQLQAFVATVEQGSFKEASTTLNKRPQVIAKLVNALEDSCDQTLFERQVRRLTITEAGKNLYPFARRIILDSEQFKRQLMALSSDLPSEFKVAIDTSIFCADISACYLAVLEEIPTIKLEVLSGDTSQVLEWITSGNAEIGLIYSSFSVESGLIQIPAFNFSVIEVASPDFIQRGAVISETELAHLAQIVPKFVYQKKHEKFYVMSDKTIICNNMQEMIQMAIAGFGWSRLPAFLVEPYLQSEQLHEFSIEGGSSVTWYANVIHVDQAELTLASDIFLEKVHALPDRLI